jgi:hypothetical protein
MFDFAADARNQGGEPGMNHKGLVTFDRKTKKDSFYAYKAYWSKEPFVHIAGKRFANRTGGSTVVKVYTNTNGVKLFNNGTEIAGKTKDGKVFEFKIKLEKVNNIKAVGGKIVDGGVGDGKIVNGAGGAVVNGTVAGDTIVNGAAPELVDECVINKVETPDPAYKLHVKSETQSWQK